MNNRILAFPKSKIKRFAPTWREGALRKSVTQRSEMLPQAQHDNKKLFCHSEEQRDEESRVLQRSPPFTGREANTFTCG